MGNLNTKRTLLLMSISVRIKKFSRYVLPTLPLQDITWIYYISLLRKHLIAYCRETWGDSYEDKIIKTTTKNSSNNIVYMVVSVKRYWNKFTKTEYKLYWPFVIYLDFESVLLKQDLFKPTSSKSFTTHYQHHIPCESCIFVKCNDE